MYAKFDPLCHTEIPYAEFPNHKKITSENDVLGVFVPWFKAKMAEFRRTKHSWPICFREGCGRELAVKIFQGSEFSGARTILYIICPGTNFATFSTFVSDTLKKHGYL